MAAFNVAALCCYTENSSAVRGQPVPCHICHPPRKTAAKSHQVPVRLPRHTSSEHGHLGPRHPPHVEDKQVKPRTAPRATSMLIACTHARIRAHHYMFLRVYVNTCVHTWVMIAFDKHALALTVLSGNLSLWPLYHVW